MSPAEAAPAAVELLLPLETPRRDAETLRQDLETLGGSRVALTLTRNRVRLLSVRFATPDGVRLRVCQEWLTAPDAAVEALGLYLRTRAPGAWRQVLAHTHALSPVAVARPRGASPAGEPRGRVWDLVALRDTVNRDFFQGRVTCAIRWGRRPSPPPRGRRPRVRRSIRFGSWDAASRTIRIHPWLDDPRVPSAFMHYLVFHEMLHAVVPVNFRDGRRQVHSSAFRALERAYPDLPRMRRLGRELLRLFSGQMPT